MDVDVVVFRRPRVALRFQTTIIPSGGLTLIVGSQKKWVFLQRTEATPRGHLPK
jgi:hypothetical protein